jgi:uncharacterized protein
MLEITVANEIFSLLPEKALLRQATGELIIADIHLGKGTHFNKAGISIPKASLDKEMENLELMLNKYLPNTVIFLGDLFHSTINSEWTIFVDFLNAHPELKIILVKGNHDSIDHSYYQHKNFSVVDILEFQHFVYSHEPITHHKLVICGHIHPAIRMKGKAKQALTLPCFYRNDKHLILPAFGALTGLHVLAQKQALDIWAITHDSVFKI